MNYRFSRSCRTIAILGLAVLAGVSSAFAGTTGKLKGTVKSVEGAPVEGAIVALLNLRDAPATRFDPKNAIASVTTDNRGRFIAKNIVPGRYALRVTAAGYGPQQLSQIEIKPDDALSYHFELRRAGRLVDMAKGDDDYKYVVLASRRHVLRLNEEEPDVTDPQDAGSSAGPSVALTSAKRSPHGLLRFSTVSSAVPGADSALSYGASFAIRERLGSNAEEVLVGQFGGGPWSPAHFGSVTNIQAGDRHNLQLAIGYSHALLRTIRKNREGALDELAISAIDRFRIFGPTIIIFGFEYSRYSGAGATSLFEPRLGLQFDAPHGVRLSAQLLTASSAQAQDIEHTEDGEVSFEQVSAAPMAADGTSVIGRARRAEFSVEKTLGQKSTVEAAVFFDTVTGHGIGLVALPIDASLSLVGASIGDLNGPVRGSRIVYSRRMGKSVTGQFGYSFGQGQVISANGIQDPASLFSEHSFQIAVAKIDVDLESGTRLSTVFRLTPTGVTFAIDPFQGTMRALQPGLSFFVAQPIPSFGILPGKWEGSFDVNNVLGQQTSVHAPSGRLLLWNMQRQYRGAISVRF